MDISIPITYESLVTVAGATVFLNYTVQLIKTLQMRFAPQLQLNYMVVALIVDFILVGLFFVAQIYGRVDLIELLFTNGTRLYEILAPLFANVALLAGTSTALYRYGNCKQIPGFGLSASPGLEVELPVT